MESKLMTTKVSGKLDIQVLSTATFPWALTCDKTAFILCSYCCLFYQASIDTLIYKVIKLSEICLTAAKMYNLNIWKSEFQYILINKQANYTISIPLAIPFSLFLSIQPSTFFVSLSSILCFLKTIYPLPSVLFLPLYIGYCIQWNSLSHVEWNSLSLVLCHFLYVFVSAFKQNC